MGGSGIEVESKKWHGSQFSFTLQLPHLNEGERMQFLHPPVRLRGTLSPDKPAGVPKSILIAEDNQLNQTVLARYVQQRGHNCQVASNGQEALAAHDKANFDLILMDIQMPVMGGIEATKRIREREQQLQLTPVPIIGISGHASNEYREQAIAAGMSDYLVKPFVRDEIFTKLKHWLAVSPPPTENPNVQQQNPIEQEQGKSTEILPAAKRVKRSSNK